MLEWNERDQPTGNSGGLYGFFSGAIVAECKNFPINYKQWAMVPDYHKNLIWERILKAKFDVSTDEHKKWIMMDIEKKWKDNRARLWGMFKKSGMTFEQGAEHRPKGTKSIARRITEMEIEFGHPISRAEMYAESHKKKDGTFVNEEARQKNLLLAAQNDGSMTQEEAYIHVFGKEHPGRVQGMRFVAYLVRSFGGQMSYNLAPNGPHQTPDLESPKGIRRSSSANYDPYICKPATQERQNEGLTTPLDDIFMDDI
ncbi:uncharacterized protein LOC133304535 [Gastrolobium bilobum]|uniref:uncharacterized protein LOC133304535 n=1 Tax=Gastrolobium bilobum TaxID=150636 RepID=UPI002AB23ED5|nr:uncharacterized protein LOC133304535 [Gastrolobium bilobum]